MQQKYYNNNAHNAYFFYQFVFDVINSRFNQLAAVIINVKRNTFGQTFLYIRHFLLYILNNFICIFAIAHHYYAAYRFAVSVLIKNAEAYISSHLHGAYISYPYRNTAMVAQCNIFNVFFV